MRHIIQSSGAYSSLPYFPHCLINGTIFGKSSWRENVCFDFICKFVWNISMIRRIRQDITIMYIGLHVKCPSFLSNFNQTWIFSTNFRKKFEYHISWQSVKWERCCCMWTDGQTGRQTDKQKDRQADRQTDTQTDRETDRQTDGQTGRRKGTQTDGQTDRCTDRQTDGQTDRQTDGRLAGRADMTKLTVVSHNYPNGL